MNFIASSTWGTFLLLFVFVIVIVVFLLYCVASVFFCFGQPLAETDRAPTVRGLDRV